LSLKKKTSYSPSQTISNFGMNDTSAEESKRKVKYGYMMDIVRKAWLITMKCCCFPLLLK
jgi:hypothetical protein